MKQESLFPLEKDMPVPDVPGLIYIADYISASEADRLMSIIDQNDWLTDLKRRVQHYGYKYDYKARAVGQDAYLGPLPEWLSPLCRKLCADGLFPQEPDQAIVNEYLPGQGISAHIDCVPCFGDPIASLSLGSPCIMQFSHPRTGEEREVFLEERSLVVLSGPARYEWQHAIPARKSDVVHGTKLLRDRRASLTFRNIQPS